MAAALGNLEGDREHHQTRITGGAEHVASIDKVEKDVGDGS
jgi:hypothetical protein